MKIIQILIFFSGGLGTSGYPNDFNYSSQYYHTKSTHIFVASCNKFMRSEQLIPNLRISEFFHVHVYYVNVSKRQMVFVRKKNQNSYIQNSLFNLMNSKQDHKIWRLHINNIQESDRGWYMCQVNTDPMRSERGFLEVVGK